MIGVNRSRGYYIFCGEQVKDLLQIVDDNNIMVRYYVEKGIDCSKFLGLIALKKSLSNQGKPRARGV